MKRHVSYVEFKRPVPMKQEWLYYLLYWIIVVLTVILVATLLSLVPCINDTLLHFPIYFAIAGVIISTISVILKYTSYLRIHNDGIIEVRNMVDFVRKRICISNIKSVNATIYNHLFYEYYKVIMMMDDNYTIAAYIDDYMVFIKELKKYNPNINVSEFPIV